jgi:glycine cleavage system transcriptional repressor
MLSVYGADRPGIVAAVARVVADQGGNITDLNTRVIGSPDRPVYVMVLEIHMPSGTQPDVFQTALERLKPTLGVDITLQPIESVQL